MTALADEICGLTMLEVADLTTLLKDTLNIPDSAMPMGMPMGMPMMGGGGGGAAAEEEVEEVEEKTEFDVKLEAYVSYLTTPCLRCFARARGLLLCHAGKRTDRVFLCNAGSIRRRRLH